MIVIYLYLNQIAVRININRSKKLLFLFFIINYINYSKGGTIYENIRITYFPSGEI